MTSYKIYLTKSSKAAELIAKGFEQGDNWMGTICGAVSEELTTHIPSIYFNKGYFHATLKNKSDKEEYELIIC